MASHPARLRREIYARRPQKARLQQSQIARALGRHRSTVCRELRRQWSPEQVAGHLRRTGQLTVSHETSYRHVWRDKRHGGELYTHLRGERKRRRKSYGPYDSRRRLAGEHMISERPSEVEARRRVGHGEADTVAGAGGRDCVATLVERKSGLVLIGKLSGRTARSASRRAVSLMRWRGGSSRP